MSEPYYLCYDIKGIQQFIFSVPKLRYVVGASLMIDRFDQDAKALTPGTVIFTGGGRGTFCCNCRADADKLRTKLVEKAHATGLDLRIGIDTDISEATCHADDLHAFVPESLDGEPCRVSGLWPITQKESEGFKGEKGIHPLIWKRRCASDDDHKDYPFEKKLFEKLTLPEGIRQSERGQIELEFLKEVRAEDRSRDENDEDYDIAQAADVALGSRNRWAILALDGNDMGAQFREFQREHQPKSKSDDTKKLEYTEKLRQWLEVMSDKLDVCTRNAFYYGLSEAIKNWWKELKENEREKTVYVSGDKKDQNPVRVLPFRPLIIGGDDILCICHSSYALTMAQDIIKKFNELSKDAQKKAAKEHGIEHLWPGTGGELTISAGIAYTGVTLPLFNSIPYTESLLGNAKKSCRDKKPKDGPVTPPTPTPAAIDWEHVTETMLDTPTARRNRDMCFDDPDLDNIKIRLTSCPYEVGKPLEDVLALKERLKGTPRSILAELTTVLRLPWAKRAQRLAAMRKSQPKIVDMIQDFDQDEAKLGSHWQQFPPNDKEKKTVRQTDFLDAVLLLEEEHRMEQTTCQ